MAEGFRFDPDTAGIDRVSTGPQIAPVIDIAAAKAEQTMRQLAGRLSGQAFMGFRRTIRRRRARSVDGEMTAYVGSDSPVWHLQEYGTEHTRALAIIRRAMKKTAGIRFEEGPSR